jgi:CYTH domain-containing protein
MMFTAAGPAAGKYARTERERRFLLSGLPDGIRPADVREITDRYLSGARLRLRHIRGAAGDQYKLTQKIPAAHPGPVQGLITNIYLSGTEHDHLAAALPGDILTKVRYAFPPLGVDVFGPPLHGLVMAEAEFGSDTEMLAFRPPAAAIAEVTEDARFTGGRLARTARADLVSWLAEFGIGLPPGPCHLSPR